MINNLPIAFIDSGIGGLPYLEWAQKHLPDEYFIYLADIKNFPYGKQNPKKLKIILEEKVRYLIKKTNPKIILIACNTASVIALSILREEHSIPFIGVVPAVKPAAERSNHKRIGLLATDRTVADVYTNNLIINHASQCKVIRYAEGEIVNLVENNYFSASEKERQEVINKAVRFFKSADIDTLVLGCTHFIHLKKDLKKAFGPSVEIIDSVEGVGKQLIHILDKNNLKTSSKKQGCFFVTKENFKSGYYKKIAEQFSLVYKGLL